MTDLALRSCVACRVGASALSADRRGELARQISYEWRVVNEHHLEREFRFGNFREAMALATSIGDLADREGHHPELRVSWGKVGVAIWTQKVGGLTDLDFILAAKIDRMIGVSP